MTWPGHRKRITPHYRLYFVKVSFGSVTYSCRIYSTEKFMTENCRDIFLKIISGDCTVECTRTIFELCLFVLNDVLQEVLENGWIKTIV